MVWQKGDIRHLQDPDDILAPLCGKVGVRRQAIVHHAVNCPDCLGIAAEKRLKPAKPAKPVGQAKQPGRVKGTQALIKRTVKAVNVRSDFEKVEDTFNSVLDYKFDPVTRLLTMVLEWPDGNPVWELEDRLRKVGAETIQTIHTPAWETSHGHKRTVPRVAASAIFWDRWQVRVRQVSSTVSTSLIQP